MDLSSFEILTNFDTRFVKISFRFEFVLKFYKIQFEISKNYK